MRMYWELAIRSNRRYPVLKHFWPECFRGISWLLLDSRGVELSVA